MSLLHLFILYKLGMFVCCAIAILMSICLSVCYMFVCLCFACSSVRLVDDADERQTDFSSVCSLCPSSLLFCCQINRLLFCFSRSVGVVRRFIVISANSSFHFTGCLPAGRGVFPATSTYFQLMLVN